MIVIVMGVVGAGKTTVGKMLAEQMGWTFSDADDFHPPANVEKIRQGIALSDEDRAPWLARLRAEIERWIAEGKSAVLACSALKKSYRRMLSAGPEVRFVFLEGPRELIASRLRAREGHFAGESILASQVRDLEIPESAVMVDVSLPVERIVARVRHELSLLQ